MPPVLLPRDALDEVRSVTGWLASAEGRAASIDVGRLGAQRAWEALVLRTAPGPLFAATPSARRARG